MKKIIDKLYYYILIVLSIVYIVKDFIKENETNFIVILLIFILIDVMNINKKLDDYGKK